MSDDVPLGVAVAFLSVLLLFAMLIGLLMASLLGLYAPIQESTYHGDVVDVENEAGLVMQVSSVDLKTDPTSSEAETFCVHPDHRGEVLPDLRDAQRNGHRVTITYERPLWVPPWDCGYGSGAQIITDVTVHGGDSR